MIKLIENPKDVRREIKKFPDVIQVDTETTGLHFLDNQLLLVQVGCGDDQILFNVPKLPNLGEELQKCFEDRNYTKIFHNALFDLPFIKNHLGIETRQIFDTMLAEQVLVGNTLTPVNLTDTLIRRKIVKLNKSAVTLFTAFDGTFSDKMIKYAANDVKYLEILMDKQKALADIKQLTRIMELENRTVEVTAKMRWGGIHFDEEKWIKIADENEAKYNKALKAMPKEVMNWGSEKQVKAYFRDKKGINIESYSELDYMALNIKDKTFLRFIELRKMYQDVKLYGRGWLEVDLNKKAPIQTSKTVHDGKVHGNFRQILETGRFSSTQPNLQQLKSDGEHRHCFKAAPKTSFVIADYSGQEIATAAVASGESTWIKTILSGGDVHADMAAKLFGINFNDAQRKITKRINFAILYGSGSATIARNLLMTKFDANRLVYQWKGSVPNLNRWLLNQVRFGEKFKISKSLYGRIRDLSGYKNTYTISQNNPIQATGADMLKVAMCLIDEFFEGEKFPGRVVLCVHDEIITEIPDTHVKKFKPILKKLMEQAAETVLGMKLIKADPYITKIWKKPE